MPDQAQCPYCAAQFMRKRKKEISAHLKKKHYLKGAALKTAITKMTKGAIDGEEAPLRTGR